jgi:hypothetical protein
MFVSAQFRDQGGASVGVGGGRVLHVRVAADQPQPRHQRTLGACAGLRPCNKGKDTKYLVVEGCYQSNSKTERGTEIVQHFVYPELWIRIH